MKVIFLDFDGVISTFEKGWRLDEEKLTLLKEIVDKTDAMNPTITKKPIERLFTL